ncbi:WAP four-disulfide core domain protein 8-like [Pantherophis guttatus]|uniref:WAP four-disulfide core domain protein 8-like n=1 Tax=Pantherophis guttatus TaxID=94885 RepID=A0ABM3ZK10_PANGU|nr:WAP four-disulfide core domain protein 8-like [Pantherophis guttatus]
MGPSGLLLFLFFLFLSMGSALFPISLPVKTIKLPIGLDPLPSLIPNICSLPPVSGPCLALIERWYYSPKLRQCQPFSYGGCGGNPNNFMTLEDCERACSPSGFGPTPIPPPRFKLNGGRPAQPRSPPSPSPPLPAPIRPGSCPPPLAFPVKSCGEFCFSDDSCPGDQRCCDTGCGHQCHLAVGAIRGYCPRRSPWRSPLDRHPLLCGSSCHRDADCALAYPGRKCCRYGCSESCVPPVEEHPGVCPKMPVLQTFAPCNDTCTDDRQCPLEEKCCFDGCRLSCLDPDHRSRCHLPAKPGPCPAVHRRYFYSRSHGRCRFFLYGCMGNANNFRSRSECQRACGRSRPGRPGPI